MTTTQSVAVHRSLFEIEADAGYATHIASRFEPHTVNLLNALTDANSSILDVGANIGMTSIAMAQMAQLGRVVAVEPVKAAFDMLRGNVERAGLGNISFHNFALGDRTGSVVMQGSRDNASGSFVADRHTIEDSEHFLETVTMKRLDDAWPQFGMARLDLIKIDVEGCEIDVLTGAKEVLRRYHPNVMLEMNYAALNLWRGMSVPEFVSRLLEIFPHVFAVHEQEYRDLGDRAEAHEVMFAHLTGWRYMDIVAGYDRADLIGRLNRLGELFDANQKAYAALVPPPPPPRPVVVNDRTGPDA